MGHNQRKLLSEDKQRHLAFVEVYCKTTWGNVEQKDAIELASFCYQLAPVEDFYISNVVVYPSSKYEEFSNTLKCVKDNIITSCAEMRSGNCYNVAIILDTSDIDK